MRVLQVWARVALEGRYPIPIEVIVVDSKYTRGCDRDAWRKKPPCTAEQSYRQTEASRVFVTLPKVSTCFLISQMVMSYVPLNAYLNKFESVNCIAGGKSTLPVSSGKGLVRGGSAFPKGRRRERRRGERSRSRETESARGVVRGVTESLMHGTQTGREGKAGLLSHGFGDDLRRARQEGYIYTSTLHE